MKGSDVKQNDAPDEWETVRTGLLNTGMVRENGLSGFGIVTGESNHCPRAPYTRPSQDGRISVISKYILDIFRKVVSTLQP